MNLFPQLSTSEKNSLIKTISKQQRNAQLLFMLGGKLLLTPENREMIRYFINAVKRKAQLLLDDTHSLEIQHTASEKLFNTYTSLLITSAPTRIRLASGKHEISTLEQKNIRLIIDLFKENMMILADSKVLLTQAVRAKEQEKQEYFNQIKASLDRLYTSIQSFSQCIHDMRLAEESIKSYVGKMTNINATLKKIETQLIILVSCTKDLRAEFPISSDMLLQQWSKETNGYRAIEEKLIDTISRYHKLKEEYDMHLTHTRTPATTQKKHALNTNPTVVSNNEEDTKIIHAISQTSDLQLDHLHELV